MSQEIEIVRRLYDPVASRDTATVLSLYDPEIEWDFSRHPFGHMVGVDEMVDAGEHVIVFVTQRGRGRTSGIEVGGAALGVWTIRDPRVVRVVWF